MGVGWGLGLRRSRWLPTWFILLVIDSVATFANTDVSVERKQDFLRSTHLTEIPLPRADLGGNMRREGRSNRVVKRIFYSLLK